MIRVFADGQQFGEPYCCAIPFTVIRGDEIELHGVLRAPRLCQMRALYASLRQQGYVVVRTRKGGANPGVRRIE